MDTFCFPQRLQRPITLQHHPLMAMVSSLAADGSNTTTMTYQNLATIMSRGPPTLKEQPMSRYSEEQMSGSARHTYSEPTEEERALMAMSTTQREELIDRMRYDAARATHLEKEARMKAQIAAATEVSLAGNHWYQAQQRGQLSQRVSVTNGQTTVEQLNAKAPPSNSSAFSVPPRALVDSLPVTIGGIQLGPKQARQMAEDGEISMEDYGEAVARAVAPYGYGSFR
ncbi:hypothetical protein X739_25760 [Mesorhizobium sp. LNHC220B00]|nr:hypothetical protein X739_25760 [Mesorhizobium sp. LNHC220B00]